MSTKPAIVIAQGSWQKGSAWNLFVEKLRAAGYPAEHVDLPSIGSTATPLPGLPEDIAAIRSVISRFRDIGRKVVVLCHSSGGVSGSNAVAGCDNVSGVIYMAAFVPLKGKALTQAPNGPPQPWIDVQGDRYFLRKELLAASLFHDLDEESQNNAVDEISYTSAVLFEGVSTYEPWSEGVPCAYILCSEDKAFHMPNQLEMAARLGPRAVTTSIKSSHSPFLSMPDELVTVVTGVADKFNGKAEA
ncbi:alpha/beta-hydrolase [Hypoxylon rubiginosum]|uniref:Alpha/beta-hydrolase n=1 Tax=Hypoxylon rubiginosum TaxID=110542 RepID=A0ACC0CNE6_9PEZI|nr:alpha/beta-hydrolase [Hypoxylon rubiginosum]